MAILIAILIVLHHFVNCAKGVIMKHRKTSLLAWALCGIIIVAASLNAAAILANRSADINVFKIAQVVIAALMAIVFAAVAALIVSRQPRNVIGWLLIAPALVIVIPADQYLKGFPSASDTPTVTLLLALWYSGWAWLLLIFPILFIPLLFPTGRPLSPRWRWLIVIGLGMCAFLIFFATFISTLGGPTGLGWTVPNPIGFLPEESFPYTLWVVVLLLLTVSSAASLFVRYRRAAGDCPGDDAAGACEPVAEADRRRRTVTVVKQKGVGGGMKRDFRSVRREERQE
ncbi:MAG: hypothetical protein IT330_01155 [Anaerolineae bacterium]|nr:hypothetical protein [Anaerolineae bacterium]